MPSLRFLTLDLKVQPLFNSKELAACSSVFARLEYLHYSTFGIKNLSFLSCAFLLKTLRIHDECLEDLTPISILPLLQELDIRKTHVHSVSVMRHAPQLRIMYIRDYNISDAHELLRQKPHLKFSC